MSRLVFLKLRDVNLRLLYPFFNPFFLTWKRALGHWKMQHRYMHLWQCHCHRLVFQPFPVLSGGFKVGETANPGFYWHGWVVQPEQKPSMRTQACVLFQLQPILYRGSYPGPCSSFHCYAFTTAVAQLAIDVCNTSAARDKVSHNSPVSLIKTLPCPIWKCLDYRVE